MCGRHGAQSQGYPGAIGKVSWMRLDALTLDDEIEAMSRFWERDRFDCQQEWVIATQNNG
jgi:hypothetical protein